MNHNRSSAHTRLRHLFSALNHVNMSAIMMPGLVVCSTLGLSSCAIDERTEQSQLKVKSQHKRLAKQKDDFIISTQANHKQRQDYQKINRPWVAGASISLTQDMTIPDALKKHVNTTLIFRHKSNDILEIAKRIAHATAIPVRVRPEAQLPAHLFLPKLASDIGGQTFISPPTLHL